MAIKKVKLRDAEATREKILECATHCFAKAGLNGTSVDEIITKAHINKQLIYYYYGSKEKLYREVHVRGWKKLQDWFMYQLSLIPEYEGLDVDAIQRLILESVKILNTFIANNVAFQRLVTWDALEGGKVTRSLWEDMRKPLVEHFHNLIEVGKEMGVISKEYDAAHTLISILGMVTFYHIHSNSLEEILQTKPTDAKTLKKREEQVLFSVKKMLY